MPLPPYSLGLAPCDFWLKGDTKGKAFESVQDTEAATTAQLKIFMMVNFQLLEKMARTIGEVCLKLDVLQEINDNVFCTVIIFKD